MNLKHTAGPWELSESTYREGFGTYRRVEQVEDFGDIVGLVCVKHTVNHTLNDAGEANARLIAAAPDLLKALEPFVLANSSEEFVTLVVRSGDITKARAAIAKATGGAA